ncbi:hypothetical protein [Neorhodopirellula pilleata]|uniref:Uncharacterized protein n=1 Tax=Neorhodopirellula pilleata TaxID=2714738 RepID=A0A5C6AU51_9BACT|nr:hypothetical protein [Neorhodopirellula pilleata]TWU01684.1 hypothetical protein Pla100_14190 [Neorhodopirellula pilleata]
MSRFDLLVLLLATFAHSGPNGLWAEDSVLPGGPQVVFQEDFESGVDRWEVLDPETWKWTEHDDNHTFAITERGSKYVPPTRSPGHVALIQDLELGSFEMTFRVRSTKDTGNHRDCCVFFNYRDSKHFYYVHLGAKPDPHSGQIMVVNEAPRLALTKNERLTPWDDAWHHVRLVRNAESGEIAVYFDDMQTPHMRVSDSRFTNGRIGIGSFDDMNEFDDVVVRANTSAK